MQSIRKKSFAAEQLAKRQKKNPTTIAIIVLAVVIAVGAVGYALYVRFGVKEEPTEEIDIRSIAVLPLECHSENQEHIDFAFAMHDLLTSNLSSICAPDVRVTAQRSTIRYRDSDKTASEIAEELDVDAMIEGSIYPSGDKIRITVQLIVMNPERHNWEESYIREMRDVLTLQNEVTQAIAGEIKVAISMEEETRLVSESNVAPEAYSLYVQARYYFNNGKFKEARECLEKALEIDQEFAQAYGALSIVHHFDGNYDMMQSTVDKALDMNPDLAEPHIANALIHARDCNWQAAENEYKQAIELDPNNTDVYGYYARHLRMRGRLDDALKNILIAQRIDPLNPFLYGGAIACYLLKNRYDEAEKQYQKGLQFNPGNSYILLQYSRMLYKQGNYAEAMRIVKESNMMREGRTGYLNALSGNRDKAYQILNTFIQKYEDGVSGGSWIVLIFTALGEIDTALDWLECIFEERETFMLFVKTDFEFDPLRSEPRFQAILKKMNLAD